MDIASMLGQLVEAAGGAWLAVVAFVFVTMICESAGPVLEPGEEKPRIGPLRATSLVLSAFTPFLLFIHAYWAIVAPSLVASDDVGTAILQSFRSAVLIGLVAITFALILAPSLIGAVLRSAAEPAARAVFAIAPVLTIAAFAATVFITHANVTAAFTRILGYYT